MHDDTWLLTEFEANRPRLRAVAYRMLGSQADAEDAVQEAWLRLRRNDPSLIENAGGLLTTVVGRVCLDRLRARSARPESPLDDSRTTDLPADTGDDPEDQALLADSVGAALWVVLDRLAPAERVAFVLHDVFAVPFDEIAEIIDRSPDATRQLASRARRRLQRRAAEADEALDVDVVGQRSIVDAFLRAARSGDFDALLAVLDPDVELLPDAAALAMGSLRSARGAAAVASSFSGGAQSARLAAVDGLAGLIWAPGGRIRGVVEFTIRDGRIAVMRVIGDAERLCELEIVPEND